MEEVIFVAMKLASSLAFVGIFSWILYLYGNLWHKSQRVRRKLLMQGIRGPPPSFLHGNLPDMQRIIQSQARNSAKASTFGQFLAHDYSATLFPYFEHWSKQYGTLLFHPSSSFISTLKMKSFCNSVMVEYACGL